MARSALTGAVTVQDRLIQQALHQMLSPMLEPTFSDHSYGFRPGRSAHQAVTAMQQHINDGHRWVVDLDRELERRCHRFCRYADDCDIYVRSERAGHRVMASITRFLERQLRLILWHQWKQASTS